MQMKASEVIDLIESDPNHLSKLFSNLGSLMLGTSHLFHQLPNGEECVNTFTGMFQCCRGQFDDKNLKSFLSCLQNTCGGSWHKVKVGQEEYRYQDVLVKLAVQLDQYRQFVAQLTGQDVRWECVPAEVYHILFDSGGSILLDDVCQLLINKIDICSSLLTSMLLSLNPTRTAG